MIDINKIADLILKNADFDLGALEKEYNVVKKKLLHQQLGRLNLKDLKTLLAFEYVRDGAEIDFAKEILESKKSKIELLKELDRFGY